MKYINIKHPEESISFKEATIKGLGKDKGLFVPEKIPQLTKDFFEHIGSMSTIEIAHKVMQPFVENSLTNEELLQILTDTFSFETPVQHLHDNRYILELFHGPTMAFKDVGARFMARCLGKFTQNNKKVTVLVATSGDTGSAVAHGFYNVEGVNVVILFPKGKVSPFQEYQMTSLGKNIRAIEVDGTFDDCQTLVKQALHDENLKKQIALSSANSINVARFLPQMLYYFFAYKQLKHKISDKKWIVSVPSGNFGNLTAGLYAKAMGLPIHQFVAANNDNDTFYQYLQTGEYIAKPSVSTYSNAMDVGDPSNFVRIQQLFKNDKNAINNTILGKSVTNKVVLQKIAELYQKTNYTIDPHGAVGLIALEHFLDNDKIGTVLATAHPNKFDSVIRKVIPTFKEPKVDLSKCKKGSINNLYDDYVKEILS